MNKGNFMIKMDILSLKNCSVSREKSTFHFFFQFCDFAQSVTKKNKKQQTPTQAKKTVTHTIKDFKT